MNLVCTKAERMVTTVANIDNKLLEVIDSTNKKKSLEVQCSKLFEVSILCDRSHADMWGRLYKVIRSLSNAVVVYDRFHVMKRVNEELNKFL